MMHSTPIVRDFHCVVVIKRREGTRCCYARGGGERIMIKVKLELKAIVNLLKDSIVTDKLGMVYPFAERQSLPMNGDRDRTNNLRSILRRLLLCALFSGCGS